MKKQLSMLKIGNLGILELSLPVIRFGSGKPRVLILCGIHGNETTSLEVVRKLLRKLGNLKKGTLTIVPASNPFAQALKRRENPEDSKDLNRSFPGNKKGRGTSLRLAAAILEQAKKHDLIIDLHTFSNRSLIMAIFFDHGLRRFKKDSLSLIKAFSPDLVWKMNLKNKKESQFSGSLLPILAREGKLTFGVEMPNQYLVTKNEIEKIVEGLLNVLFFMRMSNGRLQASQRKAPIIKREEVVTDKAGLFSATRSLGERLKKGEQVGALTSLKNWETEKVLSPFAGILIEIADLCLVNTGDKIFTVGKEIGVL